MAPYIVHYVTMMIWQRWIGLQRKDQFHRTYEPGNASIGTQCEGKLLERCHVNAMTLERLCKRSHAGSLFVEAGLVKPLRDPE
jgi:hypothetical protein